MSHEANVNDHDVHIIRMLIDGQWRDAFDFQEVHDPYRGALVSRSPISTSQDCDDALDAAVRAKREMASMPGYQRADMLRRVADSIAERVDDIAIAMTRETGKALRESRIEAQRSSDLMRLCAEEAIRIQGEHVPMDGTVIGAGKLAMVLRFPVGVVAAITPFNSPVNLAVHKIGPALAAGNSVILKPSPKAPLSVAILVEAIVDAGLPDGAINTLYGDAIAPELVKDPRVDLVSFTGSNQVGKLIRAAVGMKPVVLELGGVAPTFVHHDANVTEAAKACARNAVGLAGQSCVSVQNVFVHQQVFQDFVEQVCKEMDSIRFGDPLDPDTEIGTMIDEEAAIRVEATVRQAVDGGATVLRGGRRQGALMEGTILTNVTADMSVVCEEVFGPTLTIQPYEDPAPLYEAISESPLGLQCGIYTASLEVALTAMRSVRTGGVIVNATSRWRSDQMPYGGVKESGIGREGPKFSVREMTEERLFVIT